MIVPEFWAEAKERVVVDGKSRTFKRFGWSDVSETDALENATERVQEAANLARSGKRVRLVDHKVAYNGAEGLPIREEIIKRHGDTVITRNSYGALCLNAPDVLFADVDVLQPRHTVLGWTIFLAVLLLGIWQKIELNAWWPLIAAAILGLIFSEAIAKVLMEMISARGSSRFDTAKARIERFAAANPSWLLRVYRTPNGFRVLAMHQTFHPDQEASYEFMSAIGSDKLYMRMCRNQKCFRARVSPKPWRIGVDRIRPRPGIWPIRDERMNDRRRWVDNYNRKSEGFASCKYETTVGNGRTDRKCESVRAVHDRLSGAERSVPIA